MKTRSISILAALVVMLVVAAPAFAQTASQNGYSGQGGQVQGQVDDDSTTPVAVVESGGSDSGGGGSLPFTGLDVALLAGAGLLLAGAGIGMRRLTRAPGPGPA